MALHTDTYKVCLVGDSFTKTKQHLLDLNCQIILEKKKCDTYILKMQPRNANKLHNGTDETAKSIVCMTW